MSSMQPPQGEVAASPLRLRPLTVSEIFDESFRIYRQNVGLLVVVAVITVIPGLIYNLLSIQAFGGASSPFLGGTGTGGSAGAPFSSFNFAYFLLGLLILLIASPITTGMLYQATIDIAAGYRPSVPTVLNQVLRRYFAILGVLAVTWLCLLPFCTCLGIPLTIWLLVLISLALPAMFAEGKGPMAALQRSLDLVRNSWWRLFAILLLSALMVGVINLAFYYFMLLVVGIIPGVSQELQLSLTQVASSLASSAVAPVLPLISCLLYFDRRVRSEALELDILAMQAVPPPAIPPPPPPAPAI